MTKFFINIYDKFSARRGIVRFVLIIMLLALVGLASTLDYQEDISSFLPMDKRIARYASVYSNIGGQGKIAVVFKSKSNNESTIEQLQDAMESFGQVLTEADSAACVRNLQIRIDEGDVLEMMRFIWQNYPYLLSDRDFESVDAMLDDSTFIEHQMEQNYQMIMLPTSSIAVQSVPSDPLHLSAPIVSSLRNFNVGSAFQIIDGYIFTKDADKSMIFLESPYGMSESRNNQLLAKLIDDAINEFENQHAYSDIEISAIGGPLIAVTNAKQIKRDSIVAVVLAAILILLVLITSFHRLIDIFWIGASIIIGWLFAIGCIAILKDGISIIVLGIGSVIIGIAVNYPLHWLVHLQHVPDNRSALKEMVQPLMTGNITTVSAFLCLVALDAEAMRDLGLFGSLMLIGTILFVLLFLPVLVSARPVKLRENNYTLSIVNTLRKAESNKILLWTLAGITIVLAFFSCKTSFDSDMQHINYMTPAQREDMQLLLGSMEQNDSTMLLYAVAEGKTLEDALLNNEDLIKSLDSIPDICNISGIGQLIPSKARQQECIEKWTNLWQKHKDADIHLKNACEKTGFSPYACSVFLDLIHGNLETKESVYFADASQMIKDNFIIEDEEGVRIANFVQIGRKHYGEVKERIKQSIPEHSYAFDSTDLSSHLVELLSDSFNYIGFVCGFVVFFFLWISFGRLELGLLSFLPLALSWIWILGFMQILGIQFNIVNIILATFIFGQGDDYTIFITEGLMYEYTYGRKTIGAYKRSVAISAVIMFIGIGTLIFARHPALKSLAEIAVLGMVIVVIMAYYVPPLVFRWLTTLHGKVREYPVTLKRLLLSIYSFVFFLLGLSSLSIGLFMCSIFVRRQEHISQFIHKMIYHFSRFVICRVPATRYKVVNANKRMLDKPALIICNHQSQLDLMAVMSLGPKITILTKDWVWNNPYYGKIIRASEFYPVTDGMDKYLEGMRSMVSRGYSIVVFPEGTRSADGILRFNKGAFVLAQKLNLDILPVYLHGFNKVLPKHDFMLREGSMTMEIGKRMPANEILETDSRLLRKFFHRQYVEHYEEMRKKYENASYFLPYVRYKYMYKGIEIERRCNKTLKSIKRETDLLTCAQVSAGNCFFANPGQGEIPLLFAWIHRDMEIYAEFADKDEYLVASNIQGLPANLHYSYKGVI